MKKQKTITTRLTVELFNILQDKSALCNMNASDYIRHSITQSSVKKDTSKDISSMLCSVNRVGNNINQMAKNLNIANNNSSLNDVDYENILDKLIIIEYQLSEILKGV